MGSTASRGRKQFLRACQACRQEIIPFRYAPEVGAKDLFAIVGEFPGKIELDMRLPFVGASGVVLRQELARIGQDIDELGLGTLWYHAKNDNPKCLDKSLGALIKALQPFPKVLLLGSECSQVFLNDYVTNISGLWLESPLLPGKQVMAATNPASILKGGGFGEFRLALELFFGIRVRKPLKWQKDVLLNLLK